MNNRKKINKIKVAIVTVVLIVFFMSVTGLGRFVYHSARDRYLSSKKFYFESNLLTINGNDNTPHLYQNWDGLGVFEIDINMFSKNNNLERYDDVLKYSVMLEYDDTNILCSLDPNSFKTSTGGKVTDYYTDGVKGENNEFFDDRKTIPSTNEGKLTLYVKPVEGKVLSKNTNYKIKVTAYTSEPYKKVLKGTFNIKIKEFAFEVDDEKYRSYVILNLRNASGFDSNVNILFKTSQVGVDMTSDVYKNRIIDPNDSKIIDANGAVESFTIFMPKESSRSIKFYKTKREDQPILGDTFTITREIIEN